MLRVYIYSFSYLQSAIPKSENGGGFIFDCRFLNNPGRHEEYKEKTGLDGEVIEFINSHSKMGEFLENVYGIIDRAVENYIERDFTSLLVGFGCTGGRHRSVFASENLKKHITSKFPEVEVKLRHIELEKIKGELKKGKGAED